MAHCTRTLVLSLLLLWLADGAAPRASSAHGLLLRAGSRVASVRQPEELASAAKESQVAKTKDDLESLSEPPTSVEGAAKKAADIAGAPTVPPAAPPQELPMVYLRGYFAALSNWKGLLAALSLVLMSVLLIAILACAYQRYQEDFPTAVHPFDQNRTIPFNQNKWRFGLFDCMAADKLLCLMACCCPAIRWADTMRLVGFYGFWTAVLLCAFLSSAAQATAGLTALLFVGIATQRRQELRKLFNISSGGSTLATDCLTYLCCSCCAIIQEARVVEEAHVVQHQAVQKGLPLRGSK